MNYYPDPLSSNRNWTSSEEVEKKEQDIANCTLAIKFFGALTIYSFQVELNPLAAVALVMTTLLFKCLLNEKQRLDIIKDLPYTDGRLILTHSASQRLLPAPNAASESTSRRAKSAPLQTRQEFNLTKPKLCMTL